MVQVAQRFGLETVRVVTPSGTVFNLPAESDSPSAKNYLEKAGVAVGKDASLYVRGKKASPNDPVQLGDEVIVAPRVANG